MKKLYEERLESNAIDLISCSIHLTFDTFADY